MEGLILTKEQLVRELEYFLKQDAFAFDTETMDGPYEGTRGMPTQNRVVWLSMSTYGRTIVIPMGHPNGSNLLRKAYKKKNQDTGKFDSFPAVFDAPPVQLTPSVVFEILEPLFFNPNIIKIGQNLPFDVITIAKYYDDRIIPGPFEDTMVMQWELDENIGEPVGGPKRPQNKGLKTLTKWYYNLDYDKEEVGKKIELHPFKRVARYALLDARYTWQLRGQFKRRLQEQSLQAIAALEDEVTRVVCFMGLEGAPVDVQAIEELRVDLSSKLEKIEAKIYRAAGRVFNINSTPQKQEILFGLKKNGGQGLRPKKRTNGGAPSTAADALEAYEGNPVVDALMEYQEVNKILGTYVLSYLGDPENGKPSLIFNGKIHTDLVQSGTVTGRFSSRSPNLQNIPAPRSELGKKIRGLFRAPEGYKLLVADYGQMELRILASYIGFGGLFDGFVAGVDAHTQTAALVFGKLKELKEDPDFFEHDENKWMRSAAKTLNFAIVYGAGPDKVASMLGMTIEEAKQLLADHRKAFPEIYKFKAEVVKTARKRQIPHIRTMLGRERRVWDLNNRNPDEQWKVWKSERQLVNSLIQGSLGDMIKLAMVRMHNLTAADALLNPGREIKMILSVHDELVILCPEDRVAEGQAMLLEAMTGEEMANLLAVPIDVGEVKVVNKWSEAK